MTPNILRPWDLAAAASDRISDLMDDTPGSKGHRHASESQEEMRRAADLLQQAARLLEQVRDREVQSRAARR